MQVVHDGLSPTYRAVVVASIHSHASHQVLYLCDIQHNEPHLLSSCYMSLVARISILNTNSVVRISIIYSVAQTCGK